MDYVFFEEKTALKCHQLINTDRKQKISFFIITDFMVNNVRPKVNIILRNKAKKPILSIIATIRLIKPILLKNI